jgi:hypothetical protein
LWQKPKNALDFSYQSSATKLATFFAKVLWILSCKCVCAEVQQTTSKIQECLFSANPFSCAQT